MRKSSHTAKEWGKEDLNLGLNLKPMLLTSMCDNSNTEWQIGHSGWDLRDVFSPVTAVKKNAVLISQLVRLDIFSHRNFVRHAG